jgi:hypothetical protein
VDCFEDDDEDEDDYEMLHWTCRRWTSGRQVDNGVQVNLDKVDRCESEKEKEKEKE